MMPLVDPTRRDSSPLEPALHQTIFRPTPMAEEDEARRAKKGRKPLPQPDSARTPTADSGLPELD